MKIGSSEDGKQLSCFVERESGTSYLFFMAFKLEVHGANIKAQHAVANVGLMHVHYKNVHLKMYILWLYFHCLTKFYIDAYIINICPKYSLVNKLILYILLIMKFTGLRMICL